MLLRASSAIAGEEVDLRLVTGGTDDDGCVAHGRLLVSFVEAVMGESDVTLIQTRREVVEHMGEAAMVDAAAVMASFSIADRIADGTGIPLDERGAKAREELASELGIARFSH